MKQYINAQKEKDIFSFQIESFILFELENIKNYYKKDELSLDLCFQYHIRKQNNTSFFCNLCNNTQAGISINRIYNPPEILTIILDRGHGKTFKGTIDFGKEINLKEYIDKDYNKDQQDILYNLICICTHSGDSSSKGHYTSCCLNEDGKFYYFSDEYVEEITDENELYDDEPYLLFYQKLEHNNENNNIDNKEDIEMKNLANNLINKNDNNNTTNNNINIIKENTNNKEKINNIIFNSVDKNKILNENSNNKGMNKKNEKKKEYYIYNKGIVNKYLNKIKENKDEEKENNLAEKDNRKKIVENHLKDIKINHKTNQTNTIKKASNYNLENNNILLNNKKDIEQKKSESSEDNDSLLSKFKNLEKEKQKDNETKNDKEKDNKNILNIKKQKIENIGNEKHKALIKEVLDLFMEESNNNQKYINLCKFMKIFVNL